MGNSLRSLNDFKFIDSAGLSFNKILFRVALLTILSGALRKWVFTSGGIGNILFLFQLLLPFSFLLKKGDLSLLVKHNILKIYFFYLLFSAFNPLNLTLFHGFFGIILYSGFWWIMSFYYNNRNLIDIRPLVPWMIFFCFFEIAFGIVQYQLPSDHILNKYAAIEQLGLNQSIAMVGNSVRITGTFSYISGYTSFLIFAIFFTWALIRLDYNKRIIAFLLGGVIITSLMTGSRSSTLIIVIVIFLIVISEFTPETLIDFLRSLLIPFILFLILFLSKGSLGTEKIIENAYSNFDERRSLNAQSGEQNKRLVADVEELFIDYRGKYPFFGVGLGSTYQGATSVFGTSDYVKEYGYYEGELPRVVLEAGYIMLIFRILLFIWLLRWLEMNLQSKIICFLVFIYGIGIVFNVYNSIFLALGLIFFDNIAFQKRLKSTTI
jgi:hypothetical protein